LLAVSLAAGMALSAGGCVLGGRLEGQGPSPKEDVMSPLSKAESQETIRRTELEILGLLPVLDVIGVEQAVDDNSLTCAPGGASWTGLATATTTAPPDTRALLDAVRKRWGAGSDFEITTEELSDGTLLIMLLSPRVGNYYVEAWESTLDVRSFGPCVRRQE
jgi:hypothetical protein